MTAAERSVLHVLPHPGGGGETYVDLLDDMPGYQFVRTYLAATPTPSSAELMRGIANASRRALSHDLLHVHGDAAALLCLPVLASRRSVVTHNGLHLVRRQTGVRRSAASVGLRAAIAAADRTICVCHAEHSYLRAIVGPAAARAIVVHNGVEIPDQLDANTRFEIRDELGLDKEDTVAIWVGSLDGRKDPLAALRAARESGVPLLIVGDGPLREELERAAAASSVRVLGHRADVMRLLLASDIFVQTSHREGFALSLLEGMAAGLPPVVTDLPEHVEAIGDSGISVHLGDHEGLASALGRLAANDDERLELGQRALQRVARLFSATEMARRTRAVYGEVLQGSSRRSEHSSPDGPPE